MVTFDYPKLNRSVSTQVVHLHNFHRANSPYMFLFSTSHVPPKYSLLIQSFNTYTIAFTFSIVLIFCSVIYIFMFGSKKK